jgi:hypothetical protein
VNKVSRRRAVTVGVGAALAIGLSRPSPGRAQGQRDGPPQFRVDHYATPAGAELIATLPLTGLEYRYSTLYSLKVPALRQGDVVQAHAQFQVSNGLGFSVMLAHAMVLHPRRTIVQHDPKQSKDQRLCEYAGQNITPEMEHGFRSLMGSFAADEDGDAWVSVIVYAATMIPRPGQKLAVKKGYGGLRAIVYRNT